MFGDRWFKEKAKSAYDLRKDDRVVQEFASRDRLLNSPIYRFRKLINDQHKAKKN